MNIINVDPARANSTTHHVHSHTITHTHTQPQRHSTHLVTSLDNTRHLRLRTQIPQKLTNYFYILQHKIPHAATTV